jgi:predicted P-loop ATPase
MSKQNRQQVVCDYIYDNYVQFSRLRHDVISNKVQINDGMMNVSHWRDITTADVNDIVCDCSSESGLSISAKEVLAVLQSHRIPEVHPLREYVIHCTPYKAGQPDWIGWLAERVTVTGAEVEQKRWRLYFTKWFVAMVASWLKDEVVNQQVLVLIGRQGIFKTTWLEHLLPPDLRAYGCKMANSTQLNKDERLRIAEYGLIALDEIDAMGAKELNVLKSVITASDISERAAYGYTKERRIRLASFCASGNKQEFLTDLTGNRRWLPFKVENIVNPFCITLPYEQIYAQALYLMETGFQYWFDLDDIETLETYNDDFRAQENEEQLLSVYFDVPAEGYGQFMTTAEISDKLVIKGSIKKPMPLNRLGILLKKAGFKDLRRGVQRTRGWLVYERTADEINANRRIMDMDR